VHAPARLETGRLLLCRPQAADAAEIYDRYSGDPEVTRFLGWARHRSVADAEAFLEYSEAQWMQWPAGPYLIRSRDDSRLLGGTGFGFERLDAAATGYVLAKDAWGRGIATEALGAIVEIARVIGLIRVYALCHPDHAASRRVLEKCGFTRDPTWSDRVEFPNLAAGVMLTPLCFVMNPSDDRASLEHHNLCR